MDARRPGRSGGRAALLERTWVLAALGWSGLRIWFVTATLRRYGVNPWLYAAVDLTSTVPYAVGASRTVRHLAARRTATATRWAALTSVCFVLPDLVIVLSGRGLPIWVYAVIGTVLTTGAALALRDGRRRMAALTAARSAA